VRSVDSLENTFLWCVLRKPARTEENTLKNMQTKGAHINFMRILSARAYVYVYVTNASFSSHFNSPVSTARIDSRTLCTALSRSGVASTSSTA
jgi:hypothetical protein